MNGTRKNEKVNKFMSKSFWIKDFESHYHLFTIIKNTNGLINWLTNQEILGVTIYRSQVGIEICKLSKNDKKMHSSQNLKLRYVNKHHHIDTRLTLVASISQTEPICDEFINSYDSLIV